MKNHSKKNIECDYSLEMLFKAAFGKNISSKRKQELQSLPQDKINDLVRLWADKAGWRTHWRVGFGKQKYLAFYP